MFFRVVIVVLFLTGAYALYEIYAVHRYYQSLREPLASFTTKNDGNQTSVTIVEFLNYDCNGCKDAHIMLLDYAEKTPDVRLVVRPVPFANDGAEMAALYALSAGRQGKFWEMDRALTEYKGTLDERFYRETAAVYEIDYDRMVEDSASEDVEKMAADNVAAVLKLDVQSAPAFMIGKTLYQPDGTLTEQELVRMVAAEQNK